MPESLLDTFSAILCAGLFFGGVFGFAYGLPISFAQSRRALRMAVHSLAIFECVVLVGMVFAKFRYHSDSVFATVILISHIIGLIAYFVAACAFMAYLLLGITFLIFECFSALRWNNSSRTNPSPTFVLGFCSLVACATLIFLDPFSARFILPDIF